MEIFVDMKTILYIWLFFGCISVSCQTQQYDILLMGVDVGDFSITRKISGDQKYYSMESYTKVVGREDVCNGKMKFAGNVLISSSLENKKNGKSLFYTYVTRQGTKGYKVQTEKGLSTVAGIISHCVYDIFFAEPHEGESLFSERWGKYGILSKTDEHAYKLVIDGGDDYTYHFENGKLSKLGMPTVLGNCDLVLK